MQNDSSDKLIWELTALYNKYLKRDPDQPGLDYFLSEIQNKRRTLEDIERCIMESPEATNIKNSSHYSDKYWNDLIPVIKYKNKLATGDENISWINDISTRFSEYLPFENVLIVGCGNGWVERLLDDLGIAKHYDCFDISEEYINEAKSLAESRPFDYFIDDINTMKKIKENYYDAVFNYAVLHHVTDVDFAVEKLSKSLKKNGLMFNEEYVGPAQNQYTDEHIQTMNDIMFNLPENYQSKVGFLRPPLDNFRVDPSEAIHSDLLLASISKYFDIVYQRNLNGGIAYQILHNNIEKFEDYSTSMESKKWLDYLIEQDKKLSDDGYVPILFWYGVARPKSNLK